jgi:ribose transport system ATP-binding protein
MAEAVSFPTRFQMLAVRKTFGATVALEGVDLAVRPGEVCALVGQNGAGKSTLMSILAGAQRPDSGSMTIDGQSYAPRDPLEARRAGVAMIYQELSLAPHLSAMENIALGTEPSRLGFVDRSEVRRSAAEALRRLGHPEIPLDVPVAALSPAAQQLVEIARALALKCRVLVLDEPTSSLGFEDVKRLFELVRSLRNQNLAIVYISHFLEEVKQVADRFVVLRDGRNAGEGSASAVPSSEIAQLMVGRPLDAMYSRGPRTAGDVALEVDRLSPGDATFSLRRGEVLGIAGLLGAGRTRLLRALFGLEAVRAGTVTLGVHRGAFPPHERWKQGMGILSEDRTGEGLALALSVADNITLTRLSNLGPWPFVASSRQDVAAGRWIDSLGIKTNSPRQAVHQLSGGNQQKVAFARLLHHPADVLVLDEPTRGIDVASKAQIYALVDELVRQSKAVLLVSSYFPELLALCDRIAVMSRGRLGPARPAGEWTEHSLIMEASAARTAS